MSQLHFQLESLELVGRSSLDLLAHSLVRPLLHAVESLADIHFGGIVVVCLLSERGRVVCGVFHKCPNFQVGWKEQVGECCLAGNEGKHWRERGTAALVLIASDVEVQTAA